MSTHNARPALDLAPVTRAKPGLALALALVSLPGASIAWDLSTVAGFAGTAVGVGAIVLGLKARSSLAGAQGTRMATAAVVIAGLGVLSVLVFLAIAPPD